LIKDIVGNKDVLIENFNQIIMNIKEEMKLYFNTKIGECNSQLYNWPVDYEQNNLEDYEDQKINEIRDRQIILLNKIFSDRLRKDLNLALIPIIEKPLPNVWEVIRQKYNELKKSRGFEYFSKQRQFGYMEEKNDFSDMCENIFLEIFKDKVQHIFEHLMDIFNRSFNFNNDGTPRHWTINDDVQNIWTKCKLDIESIIDLYSIIRLEKDYENESFFDGNPGLPFELKQNLPNIPNKWICTQPEDAKRYLDDFRERSKIYYNQAIKEQASGTNNPPLLMAIFIMSFVGYNEIMLIISDYRLLAIVSIIFLLTIALFSTIGKLTVIPIIIKYLDIIKEMFLDKIEITLVRIFDKKVPNIIQNKEIVKEAPGPIK